VKGQYDGVAIGFVIFETTLCVCINLSKLSTWKSGNNLRHFYRFANMKKNSIECNFQDIADLFAIYFQRKLMWTLAVLIGNADRYV
jgi:hypothetical protein